MLKCYRPVGVLVMIWRHFLALSLRAIGIPASIDYVPAWANRSSSHCWNVVKDATW